MQLRSDKFEFLSIPVGKSWPVASTAGIPDFALLAHRDMLKRQSPENG
ncbi:hypothetical protein [Thalassococcus lentus]|uniref:Uncharacterized protein n=1 Tax=Thalassococcus lentus TaxID=1210524 RepID=A0ABT4XWK6_9RHOB|nr:hypothetical protein [Thalassococcus lentus]MDA7426339.1 hypothetical protein [Thalassococcus lentus]